MDGVGAVEKALITGGTGFTGSHLARRLLEKGQKVVILARPESNFLPLKEIGADIVIGDVRDRTAIDRAMKGVDLVFHIAAAFREAKLSDEVYRCINVEGTRNVLEAGMKYGVRRIIHCSTIGVHGDVDFAPASEDSPFKPGDIYQTTKLEGELLAMRYFREKNAPVVAVRPCGIYGPGDMRFLKLFRAIARKKFVMIGDGKTLWHPVYIEDLVTGFELAAEKEGILGEVFIIGGEKYLSLNELVSKIAGVLGVSPPRWHIPVTPVRIAGAVCEYLFRPFGFEPPIHRRRVDFFCKSRAFDISKAKKVLGYFPEYDIDKGLRLTAEWYRKEGLL